MGGRQRITEETGSSDFYNDALLSKIPFLPFLSLQPQSPIHSKLKKKKRKGCVPDLGKDKT